MGTLGTRRGERRRGGVIGSRASCWRGDHRRIESKGEGKETIDTDAAFWTGSVYTTRNYERRMKTNKVSPFPSLVFWQMFHMRVFWGALQLMFTSKAE